MAIEDEESAYDAAMEGSGGGAGVNTVTNDAGTTGSGTTSTTDENGITTTITQTPEEPESGHGVLVGGKVRTHPTPTKKKDSGTTSTPAPTGTKKPAAEEEPVVEEEKSSGSTDAAAAAREAANVASMGATSRAIGAAQAAGMSPAQAAAMGAGQSAGAYSSAYPGVYTALTGQDVQKVLQQMMLEWQKEQAGAAQTGQWLQAGAALLPYVVSLFSDRRLKTDIRDDADIVSSVAQAVRGKSFSYKATPGKKEYGIMAQDLEKTPLAGAVQDTPSGKMIDTRKLTTANTAMISELSRKLDKALEYMGRQK